MNIRIYAYSLLGSRYRYLFPKLVLNLIPTPIVRWDKILSEMNDVTLRVYEPLVEC
jgi:hypothetical protein